VGTWLLQVKLFRQFVEVFDNLPLAAVIQRLWCTVDGPAKSLKPVGKHPIIFRISTIQGGAGFLPSTVF
jgi:hypothetical protein